MKTTKKQFTCYIICAFALSWIVQVIASIFYAQGKAQLYSLCLVATMYMPFLSVLLARIPLKGMGWKLHLKGKIRYIFAALWAPAILGTLGALLFFAIFPHAFDAETQILRNAMIDAGAMETLEAQGLSLPMYLAISAVQAVTIAPFVNIFAALGEEVGWRGAMYPYLKEKLGVTKGRILGGVLWGIWHWPIMLLAGYEYGKVYLGAPVLGPIVFCVSTTAMGILFDYVYDRTHCIWIPSLFHGAINAFTIFAYLLKPEYQGYMVLGPCIIGIVSVIPMLLVAVLLSIKESKTAGSTSGAANA